MSDKLYIVMPSYNEAGAIEETIRQWHAVAVKTGPDSRLVIIDDGSKDDTEEIMTRLQKDYPQFIPLHKQNTGHGPTCLFAYHYAVNAKADYIFQTDSDGQTCPDEFWLFWEKRKEQDFVIGYRKSRQDGFSRVVVAKALKLVVLFVFGTRVKDANSPFRLMNARRLGRLLQLIPVDFFLANVVLSMLIVKKNEKHLWLPVSFLARKHGKGSANLRRMMVIGWNAVGDFYRLRKKIGHEKL
jgi:glycosyltransferase involved in cell wall biosynthesis